MQSDCGYRLLSKYSFEADGLLLRPVEPRDIESIRLWRNAQIDVLRQSQEITSDQQETYFNERIWPGKSSLRPREILLSIEQVGHLVGYGGLVHIEWDKEIAELSFLLDPSLENHFTSKRGILTGFVKILSRVAFENIGLQAIWTETFDFRREHIAVLEDAGFRLLPTVSVCSPGRAFREGSEIHILSVNR